MHVHGKIPVLFFILLFVIQIRAQKPVFSKISLPEEIHVINAILSGMDKVVWLATDEGLYSYNGLDFVRYHDQKTADLQQINTLTRDQDNNIWFGTYHGVLMKFVDGKVVRSFDIKPYSKKDNYLINSITIENNKENKNPEILLSTAGGEIFSVDTISKSITNIDSPVEGTIYSIQYGYYPTIWLCTSDGFFTKSKKSKWKKKPGLSPAYGLFKNEGKYWAIGRNEAKKAVLMLYYNEIDGGILKHYSWKDLDLSKLPDGFTRFYELDFTSGEMVWIASQSGLIRYNPISASVKLYNIEKDLENSEIRHIAVQDNNLIWISSSGKKFFRIDLK